MSQQTDDKEFESYVLTSILECQKIVAVSYKISRRGDGSYIMTAAPLWAEYNLSWIFEDDLGRFKTSVSITRYRKLGKVDLTVIGHQITPKESLELLMEGLGTIDDIVSVLTASKAELG